MRSERRRLASLALAAALGAASGPAPPLRFLALDGAPVEIARSVDEASLVVHFFATWCPSCLEELQAISATLASCAGSEVRVLAVSVGEGAEQVRAYLRSHSLGLRVLLDPDGREWRATGTRELPANLVLERSGARVERGAASAATWRARLRKLGCDAT